MVGATYSCGAAIRCIAAVPHSNTRFLVGTNKLRHPNELHLIEYDNENEVVRCVNLYGHKHELWHLAPSPHDAQFIFTTYNTGSEHCGSLWKIPDEGDNAAHASGTLQHLATLDPVLVQDPVKCILWSPHEAGKALSVDEEALRSWSVTGTDVNASGTSEQATDKLQHKLGGGVWDPHDAQAAATWASGAVLLWDLRSMRQTAVIAAAHEAQVTDLDFNPNRPHILASGGEDGKVRFWDIRQPERALLEYAPSTHAVCQVKYNPVHDRLVLSTSTDTNSILARLMSLASTSNDFPETVGDASKLSADAADVHIQTYEEHEDCVYGAAWSLTDPWAFATISYEGRVSVNTVPRSEKYKILL